MALQPAVVIGADTHLDTIHLAALDAVGKPLADAEFRACPRGYVAAIAWARKQGDVQLAGVEGTSSYGIGLTCALQEAGIAVVEVIRPDRSARRRKGKSDPLDAYTAARIALAGEVTQALTHARRLLKPGGQLAIVGLAANKTITDWTWTIATTPHARISSLLHRETDTGVAVTAPREDPNEIRRIASQVTPGATIRRSTYYRYRLSWQKNPTPNP